MERLIQQTLLILLNVKLTFQNLNNCDSMIQNHFWRLTLQRPSRLNVKVEFVPHRWFIEVFRLLVNLFLNSLFLACLNNFSAKKKHLTKQVVADSSLILNYYNLLKDTTINLELLSCTFFIYLTITVMPPTCNLYWYNNHDNMVNNKFKYCQNQPKLCQINSCALFPKATNSLPTLILISLT